MPKSFEYSKWDFNRDGNHISRKVTCEIRGVRDPNAAPDPSQRRPNPDDHLCPKVRRIKIEGTGFVLKKGYLEKTLDFFGERLSDVEVEVLKFEDSEDKDESDNVVKCSTGNLSVKMELMHDIPQFVPLYGRRMKVYYRGIVKSCTKCYNQGHMARDCKNEKVRLVEYVEEFMRAYPLFPAELYGRWNKLVEVNKRAKASALRSSKQ